MSTVDISSLAKLEVCEADSTTKYLDKFPDFLIIGPQRTGTSWLAKNLRQHPEVLFTEPKELFYFACVDKPSYRMFRSAKLEWYLSHFNESLLKLAKKNYASLKQFKTLYKPKVRGEGTATYAVGISEAAERDLITLNPDIKCVLMIRNPISRAWAHAKKDLMNVSSINAKERNSDTVSIDEILEFVRSPYQVKCGLYTQQIAHWESLLKPGNLLVRFFDELTLDPESLLLAVYDFLGVQSDPRYITGLAHKKVQTTDKGKNKSQREIPDEVLKALEDLFAEEIETLETRFSRKLTL